MGCYVKNYDENKIYLKSSGNLTAVAKIKTMPHPGFPTALIVAAIAAEGISKIYNLKYIDRGYEKVQDQFFRK